MTFPTIYVFLFCLLSSFSIQAKLITVNTTLEYALILEGGKETRTFLIGDNISILLSDDSQVTGILAQIHKDGNLTITNELGVILKRLTINDIKTIKVRKKKYDLTTTYDAKIMERIPVGRPNEPDINGKGLLKTLGIIVAIPLGVAAGILLAFAQ